MTTPHTAPASPRISRARLRWLAAPAVAILFAAACGDDDDTTAATTTTIAGDTTTTSDMGDDLAGAGAEAQADLEQALRNAGLTNLASAVSQVDLSSVLADNEFTVFAPDDSAFLALDSDDLGDLLSDPASILELLQNHLVVGEAISENDLADRGTVTTEAGTTLMISETAGSVTVDGAEVTNTETIGDGVIHVIDRVLLVGSSS
jgi:transforming growth factor-beta-induced protein